jgi:hypothetical protein
MQCSRASWRQSLDAPRNTLRKADLDKVYDAAGKVLERANVTGMKLEAFKY